MFPTVTLASVITDAGTVAAGFANLIGLVIAIGLAFSVLRFGAKMVLRAGR